MKVKDKELIEEQRAAVVERIVDDMREKEFSWTQTWDRCAAPRNASTGNAYRGGNRLSLTFKALLLGYDDPRWVTFYQARELGWRLLDDQHSYAVVEKWKPYSYGKEVEGENDIGPEQDGPEKVEVRSGIARVGCARVFNAAQFRNAPALEVRPATVDEDGRLADSLKASSRCPVRESLLDRVCYNPRADKIYTPLRGQYENNGAYVIDLLHEMGHSTGHEQALGRKLCGSFGSAEYAYEELVAELCSVFCAQDLGITAQAARGQSFYDSHVGYLQHWMKHLADEPDELYRAAGLASKAADYIVDRLGKKAEEAAALAVA